MGIIVYNSNNSGGSWWLSDQEWEALERAGWTVHWGDPTNSYSEDPKVLLKKTPKSENRWLGALAKSAAKEVSSREEGVAEFEDVAGQCASDEGCNCCGPPHSFTYIDKKGNKYYGGMVVRETALEWS